jgi:hypothetical protein
MLTAAKNQTTSAASAALPVILVFLCGVSVGALGMSLGLHRWMHPDLYAPKKEITLNRWKHELDLNSRQTEQLELILDDFSKLYDNVVADGNTRILQILDERQKQKFEKMLKEHR